ncbi:hypothetical protein [Spirosoma radiotolerans]|uniref:hypothetical protein n=1 Tax=Spirosoma radiotolerans TaxID=1379870 RepID=UPI000AFBE24C|nr:hypothetical protein [Spirosoma radiotolerans]
MNRSEQKLISDLQSPLFGSLKAAQPSTTDSVYSGPNRAVVLENQHEDPKRLSVGDKLFSESTWSALFITIVSVTQTEALSDHGYRFYRNFKDGDSHINGEVSPDWDFRYWVVVP